MDRVRTVIMGAAGRDFHDFNVVFRDDPTHDVVAFTAAQIPNITGRRYPAALAGALYPEGIAIEPESALEALIRRHGVRRVVFSYSDVSYASVMQRAARALAAGADFTLLGATATMLTSRKPVIAVCAVRTGAGKSQTSRRIVRLLRQRGLAVVVVRHPMPYGDLARQRVQRFAAVDDTARHQCTIEEIEEYEPHLAEGSVVYAGVDYAAILQSAEHEADVVVWDGGNNDLPFYRPDLHLVVADPLRVGDELGYHPGEANLRMAHVVVINKIDAADFDRIQSLRENVTRVNPGATVVEAASPVTGDDAERIRGRRVLVVEDGPTVTHGGMRFGAGFVLARKYGAGEIVDPRPYAVGALAETFAAHPHLGQVLPAMGYGAEQVHDLQETIARVPCDVVVVGTPIDLRRIVSIATPTVRARYELQEVGRPDLEELVGGFLRERREKPDAIPAR